MTQKTPRVYRNNDEIVDLIRRQKDKSIKYEFRYNIVTNMEEYIDLSVSDKDDSELDVNDITNTFMDLLEGKIETKRIWKPITDSIMLYFSTHVAINVYNHYSILDVKELTNPKRVEAAIRDVSYRNPYDPFKEYFESSKDLFLKTRKSELEKFLHILHFEEKNADYSKRAIIDWMKGVVSLIMNPNNQHQNPMLILAGPQGSGKTTFFRNLFKDLRPKYVEERIPFKGDPEQTRSVSRNILWLLDDLRLSESESYTDFLKSLITIGDGTKRLAYGHREVEQIRRASFAATTNRTAFLNDSTGDRKLRCLEVIRVDSNALLENINVKLIWGELYHTLRENSFSMADLSAEQDLHNEAFRGVNALHEDLMDCVDKTDDPNDHILLSHLTDYLFGSDKPRSPKNLIISAMKDLGLSIKEEYLVHMQDRNGKPVQRRKIGFRGVKWADHIRPQDISKNYAVYRIAHPKPILTLV